MAGRLNDGEVVQEMNKMVAFIKQEALEKAREIQVKVIVFVISWVSLE
jgi:V-type H+-transporting ATPase subunit E